MTIPYRSSTQALLPLRSRGRVLGYVWLPLAIDFPKVAVTLDGIDWPVTYEPGGPCPYWYIEVPPQYVTREDRATCFPGAHYVSDEEPNLPWQQNGFQVNGPERADKSVLRQFLEGRRDFGPTNSLAAVDDAQHDHTVIVRADELWTSDAIVVHDFEVAALAWPLVNSFFQDPLTSVTAGEIQLTQPFRTDPAMAVANYSATNPAFVAFLLYSADRPSLQNVQNVLRIVKAQVGPITTVSQVNISLAFRSLTVEQHVNFVVTAP